MFEAGLVSVVILACTLWASRMAGILADRADQSRTAQTVAFQNMRAGLETALLVSAGDTRDVLRLLIRAVDNQHHADLIISLADALTAEMTAVTSRQAAMDNAWFDLSTRVETTAAHKFLRVP